MGNWPIYFDYDAIENGIRLKSIKNDECCRIVHIPAMIDNLSVIELGESLFAGRSDFTEIFVPEGVEKIGNGVFANCENLISVHLPNSLRIIGDTNDFYRTEVRKIEVEEGKILELKQVSKIGTGVFENCKSLKKIVIPDNVIEMSEHIFSRCFSLRQVVLGNALKRIPAGAFSQCVSLFSIVVPGNVDVVDESAFYECYMLSSVWVEEGVKSIEASALGLCALGNMILPKSLKKIDIDAFAECIDYRNIHIMSQSSDIISAFVNEHQIKWTDISFYDEMVKNV